MSLFSVIKILVFGFLIATVPAYLGYYVQGGALEVGRASTRSVVSTSILILFFEPYPHSIVIQMIEIINICKSFDGRMVLKGIFYAF